MPWYFYLLEFLGGALFVNGVPHFVHGVSGAPFQSPFASPPGVGESSPLSNALWGFGNIGAGVLLMHFFPPTAAGGWIAFGAGALVICVQASLYFGKVRAGK